MTATKRVTVTFNREPTVCATNMRALGVGEDFATSRTGAGRVFTWQYTNNALDTYDLSPDTGQLAFPGSTELLNRGGQRFSVTLPTFFQVVRIETTTDPLTVRVITPAPIAAGFGSMGVGLQSAEIFIEEDQDPLVTFESPVTVGDGWETRHARFLIAGYNGQGIIRSGFVVQGPGT